MDEFCDGVRKVLGADVPYDGLRALHAHYFSPSFTLQITFTFYVLSPAHVYTQAYDVRDLHRVEHVVPYYMRKPDYVAHGCVLPVQIGVRDALQMTLFAGSRFVASITRFVEEIEDHVERGV